MCFFPFFLYIVTNNSKYFFLWLWVYFRDRYVPLFPFIYLT